MKALLFTCLLLLGGHLYAQDALADARHLSESAAYAESSQLLLAYIDAHPARRYDLGRAWILHSYNLLQQGRLTEARAANKESTDLRRSLRSSEIVENYLREAQINLADGQPAAALIATENGMLLMIEDPCLYADLNTLAARALLRMDKPADATRYLHNAEDILIIELGNKHPYFIEQLQMAAYDLFRARQYGPAFERYARAYHLLDADLLRARALLNAQLCYRLYAGQ